MKEKIKRLEGEKEKKKGALIIYELNTKKYEVYDLEENFVREVAEFKREDILSKQDIEKLIEIERNAFSELYEEELSFAAQDFSELIEEKNLNGINIIFKKGGGCRLSY